ncbi:MAG: hypothetical protein Q8J69_09930 [Sphingobacteriaceae bacterium]|nr:hypothetical protein [Sphingobacteriaceae bacterium]
MNCVLKCVSFWGWLLLLSSCKPNPIVKLDEAPLIRIESVTPTTIREFAGRVTVVLQYEDGDGDMGSVHPDSLLLEVQDDRLTAPDYYFVPPLSPVGSNVPIRGKLNFTLNGTFIFGNGSFEETIYSIRLRDRSGKWSNKVNTPAILINRN